MHYARLIFSPTVLSIPSVVSLPCTVLLDAPGPRLARAIFSQTSRPLMLHTPDPLYSTDQYCRCSYIHSLHATSVQRQNHYIQPDPYYTLLVPHSQTYWMKDWCPSSCASSPPPPETGPPPPPPRFIFNIAVVISFLPTFLIPTLLSPGPPPSISWLSLFHRDL